MAKTKFAEVLDLIKAVLALITELVPIASDAVGLVNRVRQVVADYKATLSDDSAGELSEN